MKFLRIVLLIALGIGVFACRGPQDTATGQTAYTVQIDWHDEQQEIDGFGLSAAFRQAEEAVHARTKKLLGAKGSRTADSFHRELGKLMWENCGMARNAAGLKEAIQKIPELRAEFWENVTVPGSGQELNMALENAGRVVESLEPHECVDHRLRQCNVDRIGHVTATRTLCGRDRFLEMAQPDRRLGAKKIRIDGEFRHVLPLNGSKQCACLVVVGRQSGQPRPPQRVEEQCGVIANGDMERQNAIRLRVTSELCEETRQDLVVVCVVRRRNPFYRHAGFAIALEEKRLTDVAVHRAHGLRRAHGDSDGDTQPDNKERGANHGLIIPVIVKYSNALSAFRL